MITDGLAHWREGMNARKFGPAHRFHLGGRIEFHGATAQRNHRSIQSDIAVDESAHVAHQVGFAVVCGENRVLQRGSVTPVLDRSRVSDMDIEVTDIAVNPESRPDDLNNVPCCGFVEP